MTKEELIQTINELNEGEGFDIEDYNSSGDALHYGVRFTSLIDTQIILVGSYGGYMELFNLNDYYHLGKDALAETITDHILDFLESPEEAVIKHTVEQF